MCVVAGFFAGFIGDENCPIGDRTAFKLKVFAEITIR